MIGPVKSVSVYVEDQDKAIDFYTKKLGFELRRSLPMGPSAKWVEVSPKGAETALVLYPRAMMANWRELKPSIVFYSRDVDADCRRLESQGVRISMKPTAMEWGTFAKFLDPDGNELGLTSQKIVEDPEQGRPKKARKA